MTVEKGNHSKWERKVKQFYWPSCLIMIKDNVINFGKLFIKLFKSVQFSLVAQSCLTLWPHGLQHTRLPCPSPTPEAYSNSYPSSWWCHLSVSSSVVPFASCLRSFPASGSFPMSQFFASSGKSIGASASASVLPVNIQDWFPLGWTGLISLHFFFF